MKTTTACLVSVIDKHESATLQASSAQGNDTNDTGSMVAEISSTSVLLKEDNVPEGKSLNKEVKQRRSFLGKRGVAESPSSVALSNPPTFQSKRKATTPLGQPVKCITIDTPPPKWNEPPALVAIRIFCC